MIERQVGSGNHVFIRWMDSRENHLSLWANEKHRNFLLSYIGKMYGQQRNIHEAIAPLRLGYNTSDELDQLRMVIKQFEKQHGLFNMR